MCTRVIKTWRGLINAYLLQPSQGDLWRPLYFLHLTEFLFAVRALFLAADTEHPVLTTGLTTDAGGHLRTRALVTIGHTAPASSAENKKDYWYKEPTLGGKGDIRVHLAHCPMRVTLVSCEPMLSSIRNVSHPAEQEMMKLPAQVCGECVM